GQTNQEREDERPGREVGSEEAHRRAPVQPTRRGGLLAASGCGRSSCSSSRGGVFGDLRSSRASRVTSSKSYLVSQSPGSASTARRNSSSARVSQPSCCPGATSRRALA